MRKSIAAAHQPAQNAITKALVGRRKESFLQNDAHHAIDAMFECRVVRSETEKTPDPFLGPGK